ncbi:periplasmic chaperone for outer membrane proteins Skp [Algoriphagus ratkowskyi]|uniref:OmpH family outer membrane protein n=1 Tax=Algoriphagus ratkowskyi TaxID=57028 RepID=A0A2W7RAY5_9BACT|nr:OmpH family outer membrane protein [Algoriphagus ratkowskyi]PZX55400.1 periplasmic chaperone for outer membrane proteins Skp [Algoriphagus ratkowskyi]TXD79675.1 OmpH family outer membrane protein [Algoriphagus ratkowskyi]
MKRGLKLIGALSLAAVLLYGCDTAGTSTATGESSAKEVKQGDLNVAFIYTDSVINKYDYFKTKSEALTEKGKKFESDLQGRASGFQQEVQNFQQSGGNMTVNQQRAKQEELGKKEQNLMTYRDNLMQELSADEAALYSEVYDKVQNYLKVYAEQNELALILSYTRGGAVWYGNGALDITATVIEGINKEFAAAPTDTVK